MIGNRLKNSPTIALNGLDVIKMNIYPAYILKNNLNHEKQIILLMIPNGKVWHYFATKKYKHC